MLAVNLCLAAPNDLVNTSGIICSEGTYSKIISLSLLYL